MMNNTLQNVDELDAYEEYFAAKYYSMADEVIDDPEDDEGSLGYWGTYDWNELEFNFRLYFRGQIHASPLTLESIPEDSISVKWESPFDTLDEYRDEDEKVLRIISYIHTKLNTDFAQQLTDRLKFLYKVSQEENSNEIAIMPESLSNFVAFLQSETHLKYPDVVLSSSNNIRVQWRTTPNRHFAVEFLNTGDAHFVIFSPDPIHPEKTVRLSGIASIDSLMEIVRPYGVLRWSSR